MHPASASHVAQIRKDDDVKSSTTQKRCLRPQKDRRGARRPVALSAGLRETTLTPAEAAPRLQRSSALPKLLATPAARNSHQALSSTNLLPRNRLAVAVMQPPMGMLRPLCGEVVAARTPTSARLPAHHCVKILTLNRPVMAIEPRGRVECRGV